MRKILLIGLCALATNFASAETCVNKESTPAIPKSEVAEFVINESVKATIEIQGEMGTVTIKCRDGYTTTEFISISGSMNKEDAIIRRAEDVCRFHGGCREAQFKGLIELHPDPVIRPNN